MKKLSAKQKKDLLQVFVDISTLIKRELYYADLQIDNEDRAIIRDLTVEANKALDKMKQKYGVVPRVKGTVLRGSSTSKK